MPHFPAGPCRHPGCPDRSQKEGFCFTHLKLRYREYDRKRLENSTRDPIYSSTRWRQLRRKKLQADPFCAKCAPRIVAANTVDHIVPIRRGGERWDWANLESLCKPCHSRKTVLEGSCWGPGGRSKVGS
jgi:5-methylcytosine-specific restriction protein A